MFHLKSTIVNLERNHVVFVAILFSCQGTDVRERAAILPDPHVRVKRLGSTSRGANPSDADTLTLSICFLEKISGPELLCRLQGPGILRSGRRFVNYREFCSQPRDPGDYFTPRDLRQPLGPTRYSIRLLHNLLCRFELWPVFQRSRTAQGPAVTTLPQVLFHRFRCRRRVAETNLPRSEVDREIRPP